MSLIKLPGLIDIHVHLRDPGQTYKEDFTTGTTAAIAGGFTTVIDMPNNANPITTPQRLDEKIAVATEKTVSQIGFYFGTLGDNLDEFKKVQNRVWGLKIYLNQTTGGFVVTVDSMEGIYRAWSSPKPILLHSEENMISRVIEVIRKTGQKSHICHVSSRNELEQIIKAKEEGLPLTCGVCPHHLFLTEDDVPRLGAYAMMKPPLKSKKDVEFLWNNIQHVDVIESDHAPHTKEEKDSDKPPFGVPGLETTLPLLMQSVEDGRVTVEDIIRLCYDGPRKILNFPETEYEVTVDTDEVYEIKHENMKTKAGWTPFNGINVKGKIKTVTHKGKIIYENGNVMIQPGMGHVLIPADY